MSEAYAGLRGWNQDQLGNCLIEVTVMHPTPNPALWFCVGCLRGQSLRAPRNTHSGPSPYSTIESAAVLAVPSLSWFCFVTLVYVAIGPWLSTHSFFSYYYSSPLSCTPQTCTRSLTVRGVSRSGYSWTNSELSHSLSVHKSASEQDIKKAYKRLSRKFHPDKNTDPGAEDRFVEVAYGAFPHPVLSLLDAELYKTFIAYEVLSDSKVCVLLLSLQAQ